MDALADVDETVKLYKSHVFLVLIINARTYLYCMCAQVESIH